MKQIIRKYKWQYITVIFFSATVSMLNVMGAALLGNLLNAAADSSIPALVHSTLEIAVIWTAYYEINKYRNNYNSKVRALANNTIRYWKADKDIHLSNDEWAKRSPAELAGDYTSNIDQIDRNCIDPSLNIVYSFSTLLFSFIALTMIHITVTILALIMFFCMTFLPNIMKNRMKIAAEINEEKNKELSQTMNDCLYGHQEFVLYNSLHLFFKRIMNASQQSEDARIKFEKTTNSANALVGIIGFLFQCAFIVLAGWLTIQGKASIGSILIVGNLAGTFTQSASSTIGEWMKISANDQLITGQKNNTEKIEKIDLLPIIIDNLTSIELTDHHVKYHSLCMCIDRNEKILIKGKSGCGKSTLLKLLFQNNFCYSGTVKISSQNRYEISYLSYLQNVAYIDQNAHIFNDSIYNNLCMSGIKKDEMIIDLLGKLGLSDLFHRCNDDLFFTIGDSGSNISGGERQRLCLARALLSDRRILVLDESISAVDAYNKKKILMFLTSLKDYTIILAAHNINESEEKLFDKTLVIS